MKYSQATSIAHLHMTPQPGYLCSQLQARLLPLTGAQCCCRQHLPLADAGIVSSGGCKRMKATGQAFVACISHDGCCGRQTLVRPNPQRNYRDSSLGLEHTSGNRSVRSGCILWEYEWLAT